MLRAFALLCCTLFFAAFGSAWGAEPVTYRCDDGSEVTATFLQSDPQAAVIAEAGRLQVLPLRRSASGARYASSDGLGATTFWVKGDEARYERPRAVARNCRVDARD
ncbi:MliC family protein [Pelagibius sp. CAU 1746]|uniref:MliC family protein n=1 Tax=Pelagibius sp. CAU 1746 TaxID=3140370 RepID=UPI00325B14C7